MQERVRYVALLMGQGGYVPAAAETNSSRRYGDCKAKTALLLAILHELGIAAEPVVVNAVAGDMVADRLPSIGMLIMCWCGRTLGARIIGPWDTRGRHVAGPNPGA